MRRAGYSEWTISGAVSTLSGCLGKALRRGLIASNPCRSLAADERPKQRSGEKRVLSETEIRDVLEGATDRFRPLIAVMLFAGVRIGELLALRWDDVAFDEGFLRVRFQLSPKRELVELKTHNGRRDVVLIGELGKTLREHRMASRFKAPTDFVFCTAEGRGRDQRSTARGVERAIEAANLNGQGISSHNFRHTYASLLIVGLKLDPVVVAGQLGHANPAVTLGTYAHLFDRARHADETRERLSAGFGHLLGSKAALS